jgi:3-isopropylmalate/(R)-2-methylmalate dehydratase small subunit
MQKWTRERAVTAPMMVTNIDTGALAPVISVKGQNATRGERMFTELRYDEHGNDCPDFILNQPRYKDTRILVVGPNFGCGSSRESAVWALTDYGIRCVIGSSYGEIFYDNAFQNGLLLITLPEDEVEAIAGAIERADSPVLDVDLERSIITLPDGTAKIFAIIPERRTALLEGLDELSVLVREWPARDAFVARDRCERPWIYGPGT